MMIPKMRFSKKEKIADTEKKGEQGLSDDLTPIEIDALKETANIGTGNAATALSNIFRKKVSISLPTLKLSTLPNVSKEIAGPKEMVVGIYSKIQEGMDGSIIMIMPTKSALSISRAFSKQKDDTSQTLTEQDKAILRKFGTAVYSSYLTSLAKFFEKKLIFEPPNIISTFGESVHEIILLQVGLVRKVILIMLDIKIDDTEINTGVVLLFTQDSLKPLLLNLRKKISG